MSYENEKTRPGGQPDEGENQNSQAISGLSSCELAPTCVNEAPTCVIPRQESVKRGSRPVRDPHKEREERQAAALAVIKAMRRSPSVSPEEAEEEPPEPMRATYRPHPTAPGWVYFAYCAGRIKIGYTTNPDKRLMAFTTHAPMPVVLLLAIGGDEDDEEAYHEEFAADRVHLEWFRLSDDLRAFLDQQINGEEAITLLFEAECDYRDAAKADTAYIIKILREVARGSAAA